MYVEELIGPDTVNTMPLETIEAFQDHGEVRGDTVTEDVDAAHRVFADLAAAGVDYDDVVLTLEAGGRAEVRRLLRRDPQGRRSRSVRSRRRVKKKNRDLTERIWQRTPPSGPERRGAVARLARRAAPRSRRMLDSISRFTDSLRDEIDDVVLLGMGGSSLAPEVLRKDVRRRLLPRPRHDAPEGDPAARGPDRPRPDALRRRVEVGDDARDALAHRVLLEEDRGQALPATSPRSPIRAPTSRPSRASGGSEPCSRGSRSIGGRYSALSPFGIVPAVLMGIDAKSCSSARREMREACRSGDGNPGDELGARSAKAGRTGATRSASRHARRLRALGRAADRRVDRQARARGSSPLPASPRRATTAGRDT